MQKKVVLIEDDADLFQLLKYNLEKEGFVFAGSQTGKAAIDLFRRERPDLILLDIMLPDSDGLDICRAIRAHADLQQVPVIFLTACASETDRIVGLELGANDYIVKPFFLRELIARVKNQLRTFVAAPKIMRSGWLELDCDTCQVRVDGSEVALTATEFRMLQFLMTRPRIVFSRAQLLDAVWGYNRAVTDRTVDVYILRLRQKLESKSNHTSWIRSVRGFGYAFDEDGESRENAADATDLKPASLVR
jgi:DNA-binding response OmpR family regulator